MLSGKIGLLLGPQRQSALVIGIQDLICLPWPRARLREGSFREAPGGLVLLMGSGSAQPD